MMELISVHVPKCAGTSLRRALVNAYGQEASYLDYVSSPGNPNAPCNLDPIGYFESFRQDGYGFLQDKRLAHGHFHVRKYDHLAHRCLRVTFLRHPVARTISHYRFWLQHPREGHPIHHYMLDKRLDVVRFAQMPFIRYFYSRAFFGGVPRSRFDFVGCVEALDRDIPRFEQMIGHPIKLPLENVTPGSADGLREPATLTQLASLLAEDIDFYHHWCNAPV